MGRPASMDSVLIEPPCELSYVIKRCLPGIPGARTAKGESVSSLTEASRPSLLSNQSLSVIQATAPVFAAHADEITARLWCSAGSNPL